MRPVGRHRRGGALLAGLLVILALGFGGCLFVGAALTSSFPDLDADPGPPDPPEPPPEPLEVTVGPTTDLQDGTPVFVSTAGADPATPLEVTTCLADVASATLEERCHRGGGRSFAVALDGTFSAVAPVRRVITTEAEGVLDCAERPGRCAVVVHEDPIVTFQPEQRRSGAQPVTFAAGLPPADLVAEDAEPLTHLQPGTITPEGPLAVGAEVTVTASGFVPGERLAVGLCSDASWEDGFESSCAALSSNRFDLFDQATGPPVAADGDGAVTTTVTVPGGFESVLGRTWVDCREEPGRCAVVVAAEADLRRSAYLPLTVVEP